MRIRRLGIPAAVCIVVLMTAGCGQFDDVFPFKAVNDSRVPLVFKQCGNTCHEIHETDTIDPGQSAEYNQSDANIEEDILVTTVSGQTVGCFRTIYKRVPSSEPLLRVSQIRQCDKSATRSPSLWDQLFG